MGNQQQGSIGQYESRYYQYNIPSEGFTFQLNVPEGEMGIYGSYSFRNPTVLSADFETGGSGKIEYYIPKVDFTNFFAVFNFADEFECVPLCGPRSQTY